MITLYTADLSNISNMMILILLGLSLEFKGLRENFKIATGISILQIIVFPLIVYICTYIVGLRGINLFVLIVEAAMPSSILSLILSIDYDLDYKLTSDCIILSTIWSLITIPILLYFI